MVLTSRRDALKTLLLGSTIITAPNFLGTALAASAPESRQALRIPPLLEGDKVNGRREFALTLQAGHTRFYRDVDTPTWGINGSYLGPTLRMREGDDVRLHVHNHLDEHSVLHWHGMNVPASMDGGPHQDIMPGGSWSPAFEVRQPAASCWYHSHTMHLSGPQVYKGLAGMLIVDDVVSDTLDLPREYGVDDIPVIIQDRIFDRDGNMVYPDRMEDHMIGVRGNTILVNGTLNPEFQAQTGRLRLRLLNAANARNFTLALSNGKPFWQIATDCALMETPVELTHLVLTPGERAEIIVDTRGDEAFKLINVPVPAPNVPLYGLFTELLMQMDRQAFDILTIVPDHQAADGPLALPQQLATIDWIPTSAATRSRRLLLQMGEGQGNGGGLGGGPRSRKEFGGWGGGVHKINGRKMDMNFIEATIVAGTTEIWEIANETPMIHPFHIHKVHFQILERNGQPPLASERGLKDTVNVPAHGYVKVIAKFTGPGDPMIPYMFHCHILEHEDHGMMGQFIIV